MSLFTDLEQSLKQAIEIKEGNVLIDKLEGDFPADTYIVKKNEENE